MYMRSFSFHQEVPSEVWNLFKGVNELSAGFDWSLEIIQNALAGNIHMNEDFNIKAYLGKIEKLKRLEGEKAAKKFLTIVEDIDEFEEAGIPMSIPADKLLKHVEQKSFEEELENKDEVRFAVREINSMASQIIFDYNIDIVRCLEQALKGIPASVDLIRGLVSKDAYVGELIQVILGSGLSFEEALELGKGA